MTLSHLHITAHIVTYTADVVAGGIIVASWVNLLTPVSTLLAFVYLCVRLYETKTMQRVIAWMKSRKGK